MSGESLRAMIVRDCWMVTVVASGGSGSSSCVQPSSSALRASRRYRFAGLNVAPRPRSTRRSGASGSTGSGGGSGTRSSGGLAIGDMSSNDRSIVLRLAGGQPRAARKPALPCRLTMTKPKSHRFDTLSLHAGAKPDPATGARATPIYQTASFVFPDSDHAAALFNMERAGHVYSRISNPTCAVLEERIAALEGGVGAIATASGQAALHLAIATLLGAGEPHRRLARSLRRVAQPARLHAAPVRHHDDVRRPARSRRLARGDPAAKRGCCSAKRSAIRDSTCSTFRASRRSRTSTACRCSSIRRSPRPG